MANYVCLWRCWYEVLGEQQLEMSVSSLITSISAPPGLRREIFLYSCHSRLLLVRVEAVVSAVGGSGGLHVVVVAVVVGGLRDGRGDRGGVTVLGCSSVLSLVRGSGQGSSENISDEYFR